MRSTVPIVVVAPDKLKGSATAAQAAAAISQGIRDRIPQAVVRQLPIADGGDGTVDAALSAGWQRIDLVAEDALGVEGPTYFAMRDGVAIVELAQICGLVKLGDRRDPMGAGTEGLGTAIAHAVELGVREIVIGLGGSASTDGGAGMLRRLGARTLDVEGRGGAVLAGIARLDLSGLASSLAGVAFTLAADVDNPLLGPRGAAAVFAAQKGATLEQVDELEESLARWAAVVAEATGRDVSDSPGAGAAGGAGFAAMAALNAVRTSGVEVVLDLVGFDAASRDATLVVTGEGALDVQTLEGKAPAGVARRARAAGVPVVAVAGRNSLRAEQIRDAGFDRVYTLASLEPDSEKSIARALELLRLIGRHIADDLEF
ncbi:glycerate kinase [Smaragdicoccus niigatensis]|uniref:glycerate kinase n=1 Tax=Smaragdicoccus niigatensis TaxID=359359 RepID=UPI00058D233A|nr:glycerate kinase [Smaragdicoccus niigatensis]